MPKCNKFHNMYLIQCKITQTLYHILLSKGSTNPPGGRGGYRGRGDRGRGRLILCYWCRDFLPKEQANHKVAQCPYQSQARTDWWKSQLRST